VLVEKKNLESAYIYYMGYHIKTIQDIRSELINTRKHLNLTKIKKIKNIYTEIMKIIIKITIFLLLLENV